MVARYGCKIWLQDIVARYGCKIFLQNMVARYGCNLQDIVARYGGQTWLLMELTYMRSRVVLHEDASVPVLTALRSQKTKREQNLANLMIF